MHGRHEHQHTGTSSVLFPEHQCDAPSTLLPPSQCCFGWNPSSWRPACTMTSALGFPFCTMYLLTFNVPLLKVLATLTHPPGHSTRSSSVGALWWLLCSLHRMVGAIHCMLECPSGRGHGHYYNTILMSATTSEVPILCQELSFVLKIMISLNHNNSIKIGVLNPACSWGNAVWERISDLPRDTSE